MLPLTDRHCALEHVDIPQLNLRRQILDADFSLHGSAGLATPDYAKLSFRSFILHIDGVPGFQLGIDGLQGSTAAADGSQAGGLRKGAGMDIQAPYSYGQVYEHALLATPIHGCSLGLLWKS
jgi:hypothetical protein